MSLFLLFLGASASAGMIGLLIAGLVRHVESQQSYGDEAISAPISIFPWFVVSICFLASLAFLILAISVR